MIHNRVVRTDFENLMITDKETQMIDLIEQCIWKEKATSAGKNPVSHFSFPFWLRPWLRKNQFDDSSENSPIILKFASQIIHVTSRCIEIAIYGHLKRGNVVTDAKNYCDHLGNESKAHGGPLYRGILQIFNGAL